MKSTLLTLATVVLAMISPATAQTIISSGHWDIAAHEHIHGSETELELALHNHDVTPPEEPLHGSTITYNFGTNAKAPVTIGTGTNTTNLGLLYVSPDTDLNADAANMPFIGFSAEELSATNGWTGTVTFTMTGFSGAGDFYLFKGGTTYWNSTLGPVNYGSFSVNVGSHEHGRFGFSNLGLYEITLQASGNNGASVSGDPATFTFNVIPEPSTGVLLMAGLATLSAVRRRTRR